MSAFVELLDGYHRFRRNDYQAHRGQWEELAQGQQPPVMIISCSDSRVDPATLFDTAPGQAFILRNVANLVPPFEPGSGHQGVASAIEYGVLGLKVRHIVVMGHAACGGIAAALNGVDLGHPDQGFVKDWIALVDEPRSEVMGDDSLTDKQTGLEMAAIRHSIANLRTYPYIAEGEKAGTLQLHGCHFAIGEARLSVLDENSGQFVPE
ncbi:carbonic anhydrase [Sphingomicrobium lutaoense]|uniref:carbonic anhydrase n=1 Tax=Sphingomicrobium lutaoense TaxID=515949 RepID=A0A839Z531_9SPHN|nr:carbonic anhydrase [Sphingomicrobium lutaoense]MBB3763774.1 carbonic anhydrase [Sphingomicrobium lutaoense]